MTTKTTCDICGALIEKTMEGATYDLVVKKRLHGFLDAQAYVDICRDCLEKSGLLKIIEDPGAKV